MHMLKNISLGILLAIFTHPCLFDSYVLNHLQGKSKISSNKYIHTNIRNIHVEQTVHNVC